VARNLAHMRLVRFRADDVVREGTIDGNSAVAGGARWPLDAVRLLAPCAPSKIVAVGRNYAEHIAEMGGERPKEPLLFLKPPSAVADPGGDIVYPRQSRQVDFEGELAVVISTRCRDVPRARAASVILGYTAINDVTARDLQRSDGQWARAKGFDTFAPLGPWIETDVDPAALRVRTYLNAELRQDAPTSSMLFDVAALVEYISAVFTLEPGDVIATGTPRGVGPMRPGDEVRVEIDGIGALSNRVTDSR